MLHISSFERLNFIVIGTVITKKITTWPKNSQSTTECFKSFNCGDFDTEAM